VLADVGDLRTPILVAALLTLAAGGYAAIRLTNARVAAAVTNADAAVTKADAAVTNADAAVTRADAAAASDAETAGQAVSGDRGAA
jgi:hypothetical protein